jgi:hypothetical protein
MRLVDGAEIRRREAPTGIENANVIYLAVVLAVICRPQPAPSQV